MIIILNGPQNSGKTTIAKLIQKTIRQTAHIEIDSLRKFIYWMDGDDAFPLSIENAVLMAKNFVEKKLLVIITYIFSDEELKNAVTELKKTGKPVYIFTLSPKIEVALTNRGTRDLKEYEKERIKYHYNVGIHKTSIGEIINNTNQLPEQTAEIILEKIKKDIPNVTANFKVRNIENRK